MVAGQEILTVPLRAFNAGELSPLMEGRTDYPKYDQGLRRCENLFPSTQGPVIRRPGTRYIASTKNNGAARLIPFEYSVKDSYMLEFGDEYMRVYRNQAQVLDGNSVPYELETPFDSSEIGSLQYVQSANTMYLVDGNDPPQVLTRTGHTAWTIQDVNFTTGPFMPRNTGETTTITTDYPVSDEFQDSYAGTHDDHLDIHNDHWCAQTFTASATYTATAVQVRIQRVFFPGKLKVSIRATDANEPNGPDLAVGYIEIGSNVTNDNPGEWHTVIFSDPVELTSGTTYAIVMRCPWAGPFELLRVWYDWSSSYAGGSAYTSSDSGASWAIVGEDGIWNDDLLFGIIGEAITDTRSTITMTASIALFDPGHVNSLWKIYHPREDRTATGALDANEVSAMLSVNGNYNVTTHGTWSGTVTLQKSVNGGESWDSLLTVISADDNNMNTSDYESRANTLYRLEMSDYSSGTATYTISATDYLDYGVVKVTSVTDPCTAEAVVLDDLISGEATSIWQEGYWSGYRGWPATIELHEQRLWFGGSRSYPQTVWASQTAESEGDYEDMTVLGTDDDSAIIFALPGKNPIRWLHSQSYLMLGTAGGVGRLGQLDEGMTPDNVEYRLQTTNAAQGIQPVGIGDVLLYVERGGRKVRQYLYSYDVDQFIAPDVSLLAEHITADGLTSLALQMDPLPMIWSTRSDGQVATMTYLRDEGVAAWARQNTDGTIESVGRLPGDEEDEIWWIVSRAIDGNTVRYVELMQPQNWGADQNDCWFVDSGLSFDGGDAVAIADVNQTNPALVTVAAWPTDGDGTLLADGDQVRFSGVLGMTELNGNVYAVDDANSTALTLTLNDANDVADVNAIGFTAYIAEGTIQRVENTLGGLDHLEGDTVTVWADGAAIGTASVASGTITIGSWHNRVLAGLPYRSTLETMPLFVQSQEGSALRNNKRIVTIAIDFYETHGATAGSTEDLLEPVVRPGSIDYGSADLYTKWREVDNIEGGYSRKPTVWIRQTDPAPMTVRQIEVDLRVGR